MPTPTASLSAAGLSAAGLQLLEAVRTRQATVGVIGLGYVGLPLVRALVDAGFKTLGYDVDPHKVAQLNAGHSYIGHVPAEQVQAWLRAGRFAATADAKRLAEPDALLICVPTPLGATREPDLSHVEHTARQIADVLRPQQLIILESTTYPTTTRTVVLPILASSGLTCGHDLYLAYSPEREDPGNPQFTAAVIPKVVGGCDPASAVLAVALYQAAGIQVVEVSSPEVAEAAKILENTYRAVNIALVNELKLLFDKMGIDIWEVIAAAKTKPFGFQAFYPGPGWGGHCIPIDPFYLTWIARRYGQTTRFIELAGEINTQMPQYVVQRLIEALNERSLAVRGSRICLLGVAYKRNVDDARESPAYELLKLLGELGADLTYSDPHVPRLPPTRKHAVPALFSQELTAEFLSQQAAVIIVTDHAAFDYPEIVRHAPLILDTRNATQAVELGREKIRLT